MFINIISMHAFKVGNMSEFLFQILQKIKIPHSG